MNLSLIIHSFNPYFNGKTYATNFRPTNSAMDIRHNPCFTGKTFATSGGRRKRRIRI